MLADDAMRLLAIRELLRPVLKVIKIPEFNYIQLYVLCTHPFPCTFQDVVRIFELREFADTMGIDTRIVCARPHFDQTHQVHDDRQFLHKSRTKGKKYKC